MVITELEEEDFKNHPACSICDFCMECGDCICKKNKLILKDKNE